MTGRETLNAEPQGCIFWFYK